MRVDDLTAAIMAQLAEYQEEIVVETKEAVDEVAKETNEVIKNHCTFGGSGEYIKSFALNKQDSRTGRVKTWYVKSPNYRLTHLLEKGHAKRNGGRTRAFPHIRYGEEYAERALPTRIREKLGGD